MASIRVGKVVGCAVVVLILGISISWASRMNVQGRGKPKLSQSRVGTQCTECKGELYSSLLQNSAENTRLWQGRLSAAKANATRDMFTFKARTMEHWKVHWEDKPELMERFAKRPDEFFLRFLQVVKNENDEEAEAVQLITNYCEFIGERKKDGLLDGLGAEVLQSAAKTGFVRVLSSKYRDKDGRRIILTKPVLIDQVPSDEMRSKLYLYWFLKLSTYDDAVDPGFIIVHDFSGVTMSFLASLAYKATHSSASKMLVQDTFPMNLKKIVLFNYGQTWGMSAIIALFVKFAPTDMAADGIVKMPDGLSDGLEDIIAKESLPCGEPFCGEADEDPLAALKPGLGALYEPEMLSAENAVEAA